MRTINDELEDDGVRFENVHAVRATDRAVLCVIDGDEHWIPQSQITGDSEVWEPGQTGTLVITHWLAKQKDLV